MEPFALTAYRLSNNAVPIKPARPERAIFDANRHAYRCLPLSTANAAGWELLCPTGITVEWNGGPGAADLVVTPDGPHPFAKSHFQRGILTFDLEWIFRTPPGWHLWAMGPPNEPKDGIWPLSGLIETDWLPYSFSMNWQMTRPGAIRFERGEPFCFITPARMGDLADCEPVCRPIADDAELQASLGAWTADRNAFMERFNAGDPEALKHPWRRWYFRGEQAPGSPAPPPEQHFHKLRVKPVAGIPRTFPVCEAPNPLTPSATAREILCAKDAEGLGILVIDGLMSAKTCDRLVALHAAHPDKYEPAGEAFWQDRVMAYREALALDPKAAAEMRKALEKALPQVAKFYGAVEPLHADSLHLVGWPQGWHQPLHADNAYADRRPHALEHRAFSGVVYLNDDFTGGGLYLPRQDVLIRPKKGMFVSLPAGMAYEHAVVRVESGHRTTMAFFLTFDPDKAVRGLLAAA